MNIDNNHSARMQINKIIQDSIFTFILSNHYHYQLLILVCKNNEKLRNKYASNYPTNLTHQDC